MFSEVYRGKKVLVTGHTGFKGAWLCQWLLKLGAKVIGYSKDIPTKPSLFESLNLRGRMTHMVEDVRDLERLIKVIKSEKPDFVFHLAAQAIVSTSYENPHETISTNVIGTANVLEALLSAENQCIAIIITSDKCYENVEWIWGYKETDRLGGKDIYSGSKGAAELIIRSYIHSFYRDHKYIRIGIGRAGNVIGGGDWAKDRIVVDAVKAWSKRESVEIRSPDSTRPWQHVLEPLSGYLRLGESIHNSDELNFQPFNFGPPSDASHTVIDLLDSMYARWSGLFPGQVKPYKIEKRPGFNEAGLLKLNCEKAKSYLNWRPSLSFEETIEFIVEWYGAYYLNTESMEKITLKQIENFEKSYKRVNA